MFLSVFHLLLWWNVWLYPHPERLLLCLRQGQIFVRRSYKNSAKKMPQKSFSFRSSKHTGISWEDYCQAAFPPRRESEVQVVHAWHHKILLWQQLAVYLLRHQFVGGKMVQMWETEFYYILSALSLVGSFCIKKICKFSELKEEGLELPNYGISLWVITLEKIIPHKSTS